MRGKSNKIYTLNGGNWNDGSSFSYINLVPVCLNKIYNEFNVWNFIPEVFKTKGPNDSQIISCFIENESKENKK